MMKYQFCIRFEKAKENTAATKAVADCNALFAAQGYRDYTLTVWDNANKLRYYRLLIRELLFFYKALKKNSIVGIQYPLLSINNVFRFFIKLARIKQVKFFCIVHDLESLRSGGKNKGGIDLEISNLNSFDHVIAHNDVMIDWLQKAGLTAKVSNLQLFDYLVPQNSAKTKINVDISIAFAGNLQKSGFIHKLHELPSWKFNLYGPNFDETKKTGSNLKWRGSFLPEVIVNEMEGAFGLIWDGEEIDRCGGVMGNYLNYNNPHKFSLYLAAGLPVIAPATSAIGKIIKSNNLGVLVSSLYELEELKISPLAYEQMITSVRGFQSKVSDGYYFTHALKVSEQILSKPVR